MIAANAETGSLSVYEALAECFVKEGVDVFFVLMGDANMHWATALKMHQGVEAITVRHEHCACAMAMGYYSATGKVGVASVTSGPGFTHAATALTQAVRNHIPLVLFAGETPLGQWSTQQFDQAGLAHVVGAHYIAAHKPAKMHEYVREAFYVARRELRPVVLGVPYDLQRQQMPQIGPYRGLPVPGPIGGHPRPDPDLVDEVVRRLMVAKAPLLLAGRGAIAEDARVHIEALAERSGALLATSLPARGMFDHNPFSIGVAGGWARSRARQIASDVDLVVSFGARLSMHTMDGGQLFAQADVVQVDLNPSPLSEGLNSAGLCIAGDAGTTARAILDRLETDGWHGKGLRSSDLAERIRTDPADEASFSREPGLLDPRDVFGALESIIPKTVETVGGSGHQSYFHTVMRGYAPERYHDMRDYSAIGSALSYAIGVATVRRDGEVVLFEGDGSLLMHIQELETIARHGLKLLICILNDGAYGAEIHKLRHDGLDDSGAVFGRPNFAAIARSFGLTGATVQDIDQFPDLYEAYRNGSTAAVWDIHVSDKVVAPKMRRMTSNKAKQAS